MAWELMELHMQQWLRRLRMQWLLFGILSEKIRINAIRIEKTLFSGIIWSMFFYDADAGDDTGTANCTL